LPEVIKSAVLTAAIQTNPDALESIELWFQKFLHDGRGDSRSGFAIAPLFVSEDFWRRESSEPLLVLLYIRA
jgi:hypothetical protein